MTYIIDGHNLIPHVPGLSLQNLDDEQNLLDLLEAFCRDFKQNVEVFFDRAAPGHSGTKSRGRVKVTFVYAGSNADTAIRKRLEKLGPAARNYKVVSSDRQVQTEARSAGAEVIPSDQFARKLLEPRSAASKDTPRREKPLSDEEVAEWMALFSKKKK